MQVPKLVEKWLQEGWSPTRILYGLASAVTLVVTLAGYADHAHHPGAAWWLLAGALVIALWALLEMVRWHVRHNRLQRELKAQRQAHERDLAKRKRRALPEPAHMPLEPRYGDSVRYQHREGSITEHRIGLYNPAGNPEAAGVRLEWTGMVPSPAFGAPYWERWAPNVPCPVPRVTGGYPGTGVPCLQSKKRYGWP